MTNHNLTNSEGYFRWGASQVGVDKLFIVLAVMVDRVNRVLGMRFFESRAKKSMLRMSVYLLKTLVIAGKVHGI